MVDHRDVQAVFGPFERVRIQTLTGQKKGFKIGQIIIFHQFGPGVFAFYGAKRRGGGEHDLDVVFGYHPPENTGIRGAHRFAFEQNGGATFEQRSIDDVGMTDHPAHIRSRPVNITGSHIVDGAHGPF